MAAGTLPAPGTELGPCLDEACGHTDCALTREMAAKFCICDEPIGYGTRFYAYGAGGLNHARCVEQAEEAGRKERHHGD